MGLKLYYYRHCPSCKTVLNVVKILGLEVELVHLDLKKKEQLQEWFLKINPVHTVPVLVDEDLTITESRPIMTYLVEQYAPGHHLYPSNDNKIKARINNFLYFDHGSLTPSQRKMYIPIIYQNRPPNDEELTEYKAKLTLIEGWLDGKQFFVGDKLTLCDIAIYINLYQSEIAEFSFEEFPNIVKFREFIRSQLPGEQEINAIPLKEQIAAIKAAK